MKTRIHYFALMLTLGFLTAASAALAADGDWEVNRITNNGSQQNGPKVGKDLVVWTDFRGPDGIDIWGYNFKTGEESLVVSKPDSQVPIALDGKFMLYNDGSSDIRVRNLETDAEELIASGPGSRNAGGMDGDWVVYIEGSGFGTLYAFNRSTSELVEVASNAAEPRISEGKIVWYSDEGGGNTNVHGYDLNTRSPFAVTDDEEGLDSVPHIHGQRVVWSRRVENRTVIMMRDLNTGTESLVHDPGDEAASWPYISDKYVAWQQGKALFHEGESQAYAATQNVWVEELKTGEVKQLSDDGPQQTSPSGIPTILGNRIAWFSWVTGNGDVYAAEQIDIRSLLNQIIELAKQGKKDKLLKGYEQANIARPAQHALRDLKLYEQRLGHGREEAAHDRLESYYENLDEIDEALDEILEMQGREALVAEIKALLEKIREHSPIL